MVIVTAVIMLLLGATCAGTVYTLVQLSRIKSEIATSNIVSAASLQLRDNSSASLKASLDVLHQQINDLAGTLNTSIEQIQVRENQHQQRINVSLNNLDQQIDDLFRIYPASCSAVLQLYPSSLSGYYSIRSSNGSTVLAYCDMTLSCGNITGGWMKVAELDMTDNSNQCPSSLTQRIDSKH